jgi:hypothetical protein
MPLPPVAARHGRRIHNPGVTIRDLSWATAACEPKSSTIAADVYGNIRRVKGILRVAAKEIHSAVREAAIPGIVAAIS